MSRLKTTISFVVVSLVMFGCEDSCQEFATTFSSIQTTIFDGAGCTQSTCHGQPADMAAGGLDLRAGQAYASLVRQPGQSASMELVFPGDQLRSLLYLKLQAATEAVDLAAQGIAGNPMPLAGDPISQEQLDMLETWIRAGAPEDGVVQGSEDLLSCTDVPPLADPNKIAPLPPPPVGTGVQLYSGGWALPAESEDEVCFVTYYNFSDIVPDEAKVACPADFGEGRECFAYNRAELAQDPQSHHSLPSVYTPKSDPMNGDWGAPEDWKCLGGDNAGVVCDPRVRGECGTRGQCATRARTSVACIDYGPAPEAFSDFSLQALAGNSSTRFRILTGQESTFIDDPLPGVYNFLPVDGFVAWNSHAFNLTEKDTTIEQWLNLDFAGADERLYQRVEIFDVSKIFAMGILQPFTQREVCSTLTLPRYTYLTSLSSHMHQRGKRFRIWLPPQQPCAGGITSADPNCVPPNDSADYESLLYDDPLYTEYSPPLIYDAPNEADRTILACAVYDNGATNPLEVKRESTKPDAPTCGFVSAIGEQLGLGTSGCGCRPALRVCLGGDNQGASCGGDDAMCTGGGSCDACPLSGGITTDDEMFVIFGNYHVRPPNP